MGVQSRNSSSKNTTCPLLIESGNLSEELCKLFVAVVGTACQPWPHLAMTGRPCLPSFAHLRGCQLASSFWVEVELWISPVPASLNRCSLAPQLSFLSTVRPVWSLRPFPLSVVSLWRLFDCRLSRIGPCARFYSLSNAMNDNATIERREPEYVANLRVRVPSSIPKYTRADWNWENKR